MPNKILFFSGGSYIAGMEIVTLHLMKGLKESGYEVRCIYSGWNDGRFQAKLDEIGVEGYAVKVGWLYMRKPLWTLDTLLNYPRAYFHCKKIIREFQPDICQFCNFSMSIMLYRLIKPKSIYSLHETYYPSGKTNTIFWLLNKKMRYFTAVSGHIAKVLENLQVPKEKIIQIYNGIPIPDKIITNGLLSTCDKPLQFTIIGQLVAWKGHEVLLEAVEKLTARGINNFNVLIYGNDNTVFGTGLKLKIAEKKLTSYFTWKGFVEDQNSIYLECDVVVVPSLSAEPCSMTIIESMARGKALIVSNRGGNSELVIDRINGLIFSSGDAVQLSTHMEYLMTERHVISILGDAGKKIADRNYSYKTMTANYIQLYNQF